MNLNLIPWFTFQNSSWMLINVIIVIILIIVKYY